MVNRITRETPETVSYRTDILLNENELLSEMLDVFAKNWILSACEIRTFEKESGGWQIYGYRGDFLEDSKIIFCLDWYCKEIIVGKRTGK